MSDLLKGLESRDAFRLVLVLLKNITNCVVEDYPLTDELTNHQFIHQFIPKTRLKQLTSNLRGNLRFMGSLMSKKDTDYDQIVKRKKKLSDWHNYLTQQHMYLYSRNFHHRWNYLGLAMHYLLDAYYHIYTRLSASPTKASCFWCEADLGKKWSEVLSDIITERLPMVYLYLSLAQNEATENLSLDKELLDTYFQDMKFLVHKSIK